jgi:diketogulonate reductase-like aldo/keto reductase
MIERIALPSGETVPALGQGTWKMERDRKEDAIAALRLGLDLGMTLIDTAEMYGEGRVETIVGEAIAQRRNDVFLVSKVYPHNASRKGVVAACERSLKRLNTDRLDLYLLHWRGNVALKETVAGFEELRSAGKIRHWGVSNFDLSDMQDLFAVPGGRNCAANQILYNLSRRACEYSLNPWLLEQRVPVMAYSPFEQGRMKATGALSEVALRHGVQPYQIALAWLLSKPNVINIPKSSRELHVRQNRNAAEITLSAADLAALDAQFPPPKRDTPLDML